MPDAHVFFPRCTTPHPLFQVSKTGFTFAIVAVGAANATPALTTITVPTITTNLATIATAATAIPTLSIPAAILVVYHGCARA